MVVSSAVTVTVTVFAPTSRPSSAVPGVVVSSSSEMDTVALVSVAAAVTVTVLTDQATEAV